MGSSIDKTLSMMRSNARVGGSSKYRGVRIDSSSKRLIFRSEVNIFGTRINLGSYKCEVDAAIAHDMFKLNNLPEYISLEVGYNFLNISSMAELRSLRSICSFSLM